jgi:hypothetical protein
MFSRLLTIVFAVTLALPLAPLTLPYDFGSGSEIAVAAKAKGKKSKKSRKANQQETPKETPQFTTVTRTIRQPVTKTFTNAGIIAVPAGAPNETKGSANPSPAVIDVSGFVNGAITDIDLTLHGFSHSKPQDVDILLVAEQFPGVNALVMGDVGSTDEVAGLTLTLDDLARAPLSVNGPLVSGSFQPIDNDNEVTLDAFPGHTPNGNDRLSIFNGGDPNGLWQLHIVDDRVAGTGQLAGGWSLQITAEADVQVEEQVQVSSGDPQPTDLDAPANKNSKNKKGAKKRKG